MAPLTASACLEDFKITTLPSSAFYISDFISVEEEQVLLAKISSAPKPRWKQLSKRRLQIWPSDLTKSNTLLESPLPGWLKDPVIARLQSYPVSLSDPEKHIFSDSPHGGPNHVLINEYLAGQGIMPHKDGAAYYPVVSTVSLGSSLCLDIYDTKEEGTIEEMPKWKILQEPRSLLITTGALYTYYLHGIAEVLEEVDLGPSTVANWKLLRSPGEIREGRFERVPRTSLTYRDVLKVSKLGAKLFGNR